MGKFIKELWLIMVERAKARKACRILIKQAWSVEFLIYIITKAVEVSKKQCYVVLKNKNGQEIAIHAGVPQSNPMKEQEDSFDIRQENLTWEAIRDAAEVHGLL